MTREQLEQEIKGIEVNPHLNWEERTEALCNLFEQEMKEKETEWKKWVEAWETAAAGAGMNHVIEFYKEENKSLANRINGQTELIEADHNRIKELEDEVNEEHGKWVRCDGDLFEAQAEIQSLQQQIKTLEQRLGEEVMRSDRSVEKAVQLNGIIASLEQDLARAEKSIYELQSDYAELLKEKEQYGRDCFEAAREMKAHHYPIPGPLQTFGTSIEAKFPTYDSYKSSLHSQETTKK